MTTIVIHTLVVGVITLSRPDIALTVGLLVGGCIAPPGPDEPPPQVDACVVEMWERDGDLQRISDTPAMTLLANEDGLLDSRLDADGMAEYRFIYEDGRATEMWTPLRSFQLVWSGQRLTELTPSDDGPSLTYHYDGEHLEAVMWNEETVVVDFQYAAGVVSQMTTWRPHADLPSVDEQVQFEFDSASCLRTEHYTWYDPEGEGSDSWEIEWEVGPTGFPETTFSTSSSNGSSEWVVQGDCSQVAAGLPLMPDLPYWTVSRLLPVDACAPGRAER